MQTEEVAALGVALEVLGEEHSHVPQQTQVGLWRDKSTWNSPDKDLRDSMLPSCGEQSELGRETVDAVFPPYESSSQISAACRPPPHDRRVQFW